MKSNLDLSSQSTSTIGLPTFSEEINFQKYWLVLQRRWWLVLIATVTGVALAGVLALPKPKSYQATGKLLVKPDQSSQLTGFEAKSGEIKALTQKSDPLSTEAEILKSQPVLETATKALNLKDRKGKLMDAAMLEKKLTVKPIVGTDILQVMFQSEDPEIAARVVNQVMQDYIRNNVQVNRSQAIAARQFILAELPQTEIAVRQAESALRRFREANGVVALEQEAQESVKSMSALNQNIDSSMALLSQSEARVQQLSAQVGMDVKSALVINALNQSEGVQKALRDLRQAEAELSKQRTIYKEDSPEILLLTDQVQAAQNVLQNQTKEVAGPSFEASTKQLQLSKTQQDLVGDLAKAEVERRSLGDGVASLVRSRSDAGTKSRSIPGLEANQRELQRQVDAAQTTYKTLLTKLQEVQVSENQNVGNARVVSNAIVPEDSVGLGNGVMLLGGGIAGLLLGLSLAFVVDYADRTVKTLQEVKALMPYSVLGMIPQMLLTPQEASLEGMPQLITQEAGRVGDQEAYQMLQANLRFLPTDQVARSIVVTSARRQEGKSTIAANLALALAQGQRRILIVDADMRYGCQHHVWGVSNETGLSNVLVGQVPMDQAITAVRSNLHVLTGGTVPPNPLVLLDSSAMATLVERLMENYDFVVFDSPTLLGTADSTVLNRLVDGSLIVTGLGIVEVDQLKTMRQFLTQSGHRVLGVVVNGIEGRADRDGPFPKAPYQPSIGSPRSILKRQKVS
jgi:polysaccharide biosynthesis transport protein